MTSPAASANPSSNPQFDNWEIPVQKWWAANKDKYPTTTVANKPAVMMTCTILPRSGDFNLEPNGTAVYSPSKP